MSESIFNEDALFPEDHPFLKYRLGVGQTVLFEGMHYEIFAISYVDQTIELGVRYTKTVRTVTMDDFVKDQELMKLNFHRL